MADGSEIAYLSGATNQLKLGFLVRTEDDAVLNLRTQRNGQSIDRVYPVTVPDTGGEWRYVTTDGPIDNILFIEAEGGAVDIDRIKVNAAAELDGPVFPEEAADRIIGWTGAEITADFAATAAEGTKYSATGLPEGAELDPDTGAFTWTPEESGTWAVTVGADDGTNVAARRVVFEVADDRGGAIEVTEDGIDLDDGFESATEAAFTAAHDTAEDLSQNGTDAEYLGALASLVAAVDGLQLISPKSDLDGSLDYAELLAFSNAADRAPALVDGDNQTGTSWGQSVNLSHTFDFGADFRVSAKEFGFQSNIFADRLANSTVYGSNDGTNWTRLTPGVTAFTQDFNTLDVEPELKDDQFRYFKIQMLEPLPDVLYGRIVGGFEMTEFHIYGERHEIGNQIESATIASEDAVAGKVAVGDTVNVAVTTKQPVDDVTVHVMGLDAAATSEDGVNWLAPVVLAGVEPGPVTVSVDYTGADGKAGPTLYGTTEGASLFVGGNRDQLIDVTELATVTASSGAWPNNVPGPNEIGYLLFDGDENTAGDLNVGVGSYYTVDFGADASVRLDEVYFLPRLCCTSRSDGTIVQGSNDGQTWATLTEPLTGTKAGVWQGKAVADDTSYRYLKIYNPNRWHGNLGEVQFFGDFA
jgi:hypothetical protein